MAGRRIHVTGASGAGVTTLGRALAQRLAIPHHDTDDYYWVPTVDEFTEKRPVPERLRLIEEMFLPRPAWVLSGALESWGEPLVPRFTAVVFVETETALRLDRLRAREVLRYGASAVAPGGPRHEPMRAFVQWAAGYEAGRRPGRSRARHETWLAALPCPVIRVNGGDPVPELVRRVLSQLDRGADSA